MRIASKMLNFSSDTITHMSASMKSALLNTSFIGDDVSTTDTLVKELEERCAFLLGKEKGLFVPTNTMGNLISVSMRCFKGDSVILGDKSHINRYETGGMSSVGGAFPTVIKNQEDGTLDISEIKSKIFANNIHYTNAKLLCIENTHNYAGGKALPLDFLNLVSSEIPLEVHLDGARIWNAYYYYKETYPTITYPDILKGIDSLTVCFSKGLRCPLGSILCGNEEFISRARKLRKILGGGMRQPGYIAAAALDSLDKCEEIITDDHRKAKVFAKNLREIGCRVSDPMTNIIVVRTPPELDIDEFHGLMMKCNLVTGLRPYFDDFIRIVTHAEVSFEDIEEASEIVKAIFKEKGI